MFNGLKFRNSTRHNCFDYFKSSLYDFGNKTLLIKFLVMKFVHEKTFKSET